MQNLEIKSSHKKLFKPLCIALKKAVPEDDLEQLLFLYLGKDLSDIPKAPTYPKQIFNVVKWAYDHNKLLSLVIAASVDNPDNPELKALIKDYFQLLLEIDGADLLPQAVLSSLISILRPITDFARFILPACIRTLPDLDAHHSEEKNYLEQMEVNPETKWLIILQLLLKIHRYNSKQEAYIIIFIQHLEKLIDHNLRARLEAWLQDLPPELQLKATMKSESRSDNLLYPKESLEQLRIHFLMIARPEITNLSGKLEIYSYLIVRLSHDGQVIKTHPLQLKVPQPDETKTASDQSSPGLTCDLIKAYLPEWLVQGQMAIDQQCAELQMTYQLDAHPIHDLTLEFWLPFEHLTEPVEQWEIYGKPIRAKQLGLFVGKEYRVVVRSYDRFEDPDALNKLRQTWQSLASFLTEPLDPNMDIDQKIKSLDCWSQLECIRQFPENQPVEEHWNLGVTVTCRLCEQDCKTQRDDLFAWMLATGVPLCLWSRNHTLQDLQTQMQEILNRDNLLQIDNLLKDVWQIRKSAHKPLGDHLGIWLDEPKIFEELKTYQRRSQKVFQQNGSPY